MNRNFFTFDNLKGDYPTLRDQLRRGTPTAVFGLSQPHKYLIASLIEGKCVYVCADSQSAKKAAENIATLSGKQVALLAAKDEVLLNKAALSKDTLFRRLTAVYQFLNGADVLVADAEGLIQLFPRNISSVTLNAGEDHEFSSFLALLTQMGYSREQSVESKGVFAVHGDIVDIYPVNTENPVRIDFFGDNVESIKPYDFTSGERLSVVKTITIVTATDCMLSEQDKREIPAVLKAECKKFKTSESYNRACAVADELIRQVEEGVGNNFLLPLLDNTCDFFTLLPEDVTLLFDEGKTIYDRLDGLYKEHEERFLRLFQAGEAFSFTKNQFVDREDFFSNVSSFKNVALSTFTCKNYFFNPLATFNFNSTPAGRYLNGLEQLSVDISNWLLSDYRILLCCGNAERAARMREKLSDEGKRVSPQVKDLAFLAGVMVTDEGVDHGLILHEAKLVILGANDLYIGGSTQPKRIKRKRGDMFIAPEIGDFAVHETHGIGKIMGMKKIETLDGVKEVIALEYRGGDILYLPVERMDTLSKYVGEEKPTLSKIGGAEFERVKERVRASLKKMAFDLKALYAERSEKRGYAFPYYEDMMEEFYSSFEHTETEDQLSSVQEIVGDMCSKKVMDRLLCGDVGFGKTEVAFRAIYLCVLGGKQAALMCPSTILSDQHFNTAKHRFEKFGVRVECLNRFRSPKETEKILADLKEHKIDLIIGTHRLLSNDVVFSDLGLLVLDEEQRFGVEHKEKIKNLKHDVDALTMTATPIPRTLHMSLSGIRDISTINTPPSERLPVQTYVVEETEALIRDACIRELSRGGQVFILYNRVESIFTFADRVKKIVPEGNVIVTHGQMDKNILEENVLSFYEGKSNILVTTTIIENGIDLPNANTIIVIDADRFGVSQLYQLRGRVGRSSRLAHAYFTFKPEKVLTSDASARLSAIMEFTELGSGYKIAMRDLEIRGAGNILGAEQHGHMDKVGYELYSKLLKEEMTGEVHTDAELDIKATAFIPESYIESTAGRLDCYKQIAEIRSVDDYNRVYASITENYGEIPSQMHNLLIIAVLKEYASKFNVTKVGVQTGKGSLTLSSIQTLADDGVKAAMEKYKQTVSLSVAGQSPQLIFSGIKNQTKIMVEMSKFLKYALSFTVKS